MPTVRYVFVSDLHFGERNAVLTDAVSAEPGADLAPNDAFRGLADCLHDVARGNPDGTPPRLVLLGDIFELALAPRHAAFDLFAKFIERLFPRGEAPALDPRLVFVPGNHDHDLWTSTRDDLLNLQIERGAGRLQPTAPVTTAFDLFAPREGAGVITPRSSMLTQLLRKRLPHVPEIEVQVAYPNLGIVQGERAIVAHHGHFMDDVYTLMTTVSHAVFGEHERPIDLGRIEADNGAWIDFLWSSLGREGALATGLRRSYDLLQSDSGRILLGSRIAAAAAELFPLRIGRRIRQRLILPVVMRALDVVLRIDVRQQLPQFATVTPEVVGYVSGVLTAAVREELRARDERPRAFTYVYGHTHQPFAQTAPVGAEGMEVAFVNSGGWVVDTKVARPAVSGGLVLVDDALETVLVRLGRQVLSPHHERPEVATATTEPGALAQHVQALVAREDGPWIRTAAALGDAILRRRAEHATRLQREVAELGAWERLALRSEFLWKLMARRTAETQEAFKRVLLPNPRPKRRLARRVIRAHSPIALPAEAQQPV